MSKKTHSINVKRDTDKMTATFELTDVKAEKVIQTLTVAWDDVHEDARDFVSLYGMTKLLQDRESGADVLDKLDKYSALFDETLKIGVLKRERKAGQGPTVKPEIEALASLKGITVGQAQKLLRKYDKEQQETILSSEAVQDELTKLKATVEDDVDSLDDLI